METLTKTLPAWIADGHNRTGLKLLILLPEDYVQMLNILSDDEQEKLEAINQALSTASADEQEAYKLTLAEILGYVALIKYCSAEKIIKEVKEKITENSKYDDLLKRALYKAANKE